MKSFVKISAFDLRLKWPLYNYIRDYSDYDLNVLWYDYNFGAFYEKYTMIIQGDKDDIKNFYSYLRLNHIKVVEQH